MQDEASSSLDIKIETLVCLIPTCQIRRLAPENRNYNYVDSHVALNVVDILQTFIRATQGV
jgi:hypothetical protein